MKYILLTLFVLIFFISPVYADAPPGYIIIEEIGLFKSIHHIPDSDPNVGTYFYDLTNLHYGIGHLENTTWGEPSGGRTILVGHTPGGFSGLVDIGIGDRITLSMDGQYYDFYVFDKYRVTKNNDSVLSTPAYQYELVLITCVEEDENLRLIIKAK